LAKLIATILSMPYKKVI